MHTPLSLTQKYFELSNQADLDAIEFLIHPEATYSSVNTGLYYGINSIMSMMRGYFAKHKNLNWQIQEIKQSNDHIAEVHFECTAVKNDGVAYVLSGVERLVVVSGSIRHIEVR